MKRLGPEALRALRKKARRGIALEDRAVTSKTRLRYFLAVRKVLPLLELAQDNPDEAWTSWIEQEFEEGAPITGIGDTLSGLHHFAPWLRSNLRRAWRAFRLWRKVEKPSQAPPLPEAIVESFVGRCLELRDLDMAVSVALGFYGLLRTGELLTLQPNHLLLGDKDVVIRLGLTKTGLRRHQDENVVIRNPKVWLLVETFIANRRAQASYGAPIVLGGGPQFREKFRLLKEFFGLKQAFRPYGLRRGGATADFRRYNSMERTLIKGRWGTSQAARQYIQEGLSVLTAITLTSRQACHLAHYASFF
eukprot:Skav235079  [mRNA]  locus=scaffold2106:51280:52194:- [translate_table: standard]